MVASMKVQSTKEMTETSETILKKVSRLQSQEGFARVIKLENLQPRQQCWREEGL